MTRSHRSGADGVVGSTTDYRMLNQPPPPRRDFKVALHLFFRRGAPSLTKEGSWHSIDLVSKPDTLGISPGTDPSGTNFSNTAVGGDPRADIVAGAPIYPSNKSIKQWVNPAAFALPPDHIGRTQVVSLSIYRSFRYKERYALRIGASSTNLFNHPNYGVPNMNLGTAPFGTVSSLQSAEDSGPRAIQLGTRLTF